MIIGVWKVVTDQTVAIDMIRINALINSLGTHEIILQLNVLRGALRQVETILGGLEAVEAVSLGELSLRLCKDLTVLGLLQES